MSRIRITVALFSAIVLVVISSIYLHSREGRRLGQVYIISYSTGEIIVSSHTAARDILMGNLLYLRVGGKVVIMRATFPMMTIAKCRLLPKYRKYFRKVRKGQAVYRYVKGIEKDEEEKRDETIAAGKTKSIGGIQYVYIKGGCYMMGSPKGEGDKDEHPRHRVCVKGFWMGKYEVTQRQYEAITGKTPSRFKNKHNNPVERVSWNDATAFCKSFSKKYRVKARLPYEAEREYAARAGTTTKYYWGNSINGAYCWYSDNSGDKTHSVGTKKPNRWGLYDMSGNVWEWCMDWHDENYYAKSPKDNPECTNNTSGRRVLRGGSWYGDDYGLRSAYRGGGNPAGRGYSVGFRVVLSP